ncbi:MAG: tetratricopeptide repeat protein [Gammaproteobacteria bacterium]
MSSWKSSSEQNTGAGPQLPLASTEDEKPSSDINSEYGFVLAVYQALQDYNRPDRLRHNPLIASRLIAAELAQSPAIPPAQALRDLIRSHSERLGENPKFSRLYQVLLLTYIAPLRQQRAVCDSLHLSLSTYRRCLKDAIQIVSASLWEAECMLRSSPPASSGQRFAGTRPWLAAAATVVVLVIISGAVYLHQYRRRREESSEPLQPLVLAILPFVNQSRNPDGGYVGEEMTGALTTALDRISGVRVLTEIASCGSPGGSRMAQQTDCAGKVNNIIEGNVQREGDMLRVNVQLVNPASGYESWSDKITAPRNQIFQIEDALTKAVSAHLHMPVVDPTTFVPDNYSTNAPAARDLYLVGREYLNDRTANAIKQATDDFRKSIQQDPDYANSWAALAMAWAIWPSYGDGRPPDAHYNDALSAANKAISLDPALPIAHAVLGFLYAKHWQWTQAKREYLRALSLDPYNAIAHQWYAKYFWLTGDAARALEQMRIAHHLDPHLPVINANLGRALAYAGLLSQAENQLHAGIAKTPRFELYYEYLAETHVAMKKYAQVLNDEKLAVSVTRNSPGPFLLMESGLAESGFDGKNLATQYLATLQRQEPAHYVSGVLTARLYWSLGDKPHCFSELQRAANDHDYSLLLTSGPDWAGVRTDPRFGEVHRLMNLPAASAPQ